MSAPWPNVSVVVPVLNGAREIGGLLDSLARLDYPSDRLEILVVDNGSTDGTPEIAARPGVRVLSETQIRSSYAARNRGVEASTGTWIAFTDADCVATESWLSRLLSPPIDDGVGAVLGEVVALETTTAVQRLTERYGIMKHAVSMPHKDLACFSTANVAVRRDVLARLGGFRQDVRFFGDMDLSWRMQIALDARLELRKDAVILHRHRRTWRALWRHGVQHGRGVAFMKRAHPDRYHIRLGEQLGRLGGIARAAGGATRSGGEDHLAAPLFLALWYGGMFAGYLQGPAWTPDKGARR